MRYEWSGELHSAFFFSPIHFCIYLVHQFLCPSRKRKAMQNASFLQFFLKNMMQRISKPYESNKKFSREHCNERSRNYWVCTALPAFVLFFVLVKMCGFIQATLTIFYENKSLKITFIFVLLLLCKLVHESWKNVLSLFFRNILFKEKMF